MDINSWGQSFMARIRALPGQAGDLATNLPEKLQSAVGDLPKTVEDGAKAVLANQEVADGMRTVGKGVGELVGWRAPDQVTLSDAAKGGTPEAAAGASDPVGDAVKTGATGTSTPESPKPAAPAAAVKDPVGDAVKTGASSAQPKGRAPRVANDPVGKAIRDAASKAPKVGDVPNPVADPVSKAVKGAATETTTTVRVRDVKTTIRVTEGTKAVRAVRSTAADTAQAGRSSLASSRLVSNLDSIKGSVKVADAPQLFEQTASKMNRLADALQKTENPAQAQVLRDFAKRIEAAGQLHAQGNGPAAFRMLHASNKLGLKNPAVQDAIRQGHEAEDVLAAFGKKARAVRSVDGLSTPVKIAGTPQFEATASKMNRLADALQKTENPAQAQVLRDFAKRIETAGQLHAQGNGPAAFRMLHASNKLGLKNPAVQDAVRQGHEAEDALAAFGKKARGVSKAAKAVVTDGAKGATTAAESATSATKTVARATRAASAGRASRSTSVVIEQTQETVTTVTRSTKAAARVAKGVKASKSAIQGAQGAEQAGVTVAKAARASRGARAASQAAEEAGTVVRAARGAKAAQVAVEAGKGAEAATALEAAAQDGKAIGTMAGEAGSVAKGSEGFLGGVKDFFGNIGSKIKGFFSNFGKGGNSGGWATIKQGFAQMLPGLGKALRSSAIFSAIFSAAENVFMVFKGERTWQHALGGVLGDTLGGAIGGVFSALASGAAIAGLGALGLAGLPLTLAAGAIGILGFMVFDRFFRNTSIYDSITHLFT